jgi:hypothetical protein
MIWWIRGGRVAKRSRSGAAVGARRRERVEGGVNRTKAGNALRSKPAAPRHSFPYARTVSIDFVFVSLLLYVVRGEKGEDRKTHLIPNHFALQQRLPKHLPSARVLERVFDGDAGETLGDVDDHLRVGRGEENRRE